MENTLRNIILQFERILKIKTTNFINVFKEGGSRKSTT